MGIFLRLAATAGLLFVASCQTYPYASSFSACDAGAGACYRACEAYADDGDGYAACHADCEYEADRCFANAYEPYRYAGSPYGPTYVSPWYGSYGAWYPQAGYTISLGYLSSSRYGYSRPNYRSGNRYDRGGYDHDRRRNRGRESGGNRSRSNDRSDESFPTHPSPRYERPRRNQGQPANPGRTQPTQPTVSPPPSGPSGRPPAVPQPSVQPGSALPDAPSQPRSAPRGPRNADEVEANPH